MPNPGKGPRAPITTRVPPSHKDAYQAEAAKLGLEVSDYVALRLAELHGLERPSWIQLPDDLPTQEVLPDT